MTKKQEAQIEEQKSTITECRNLIFKQNQELKDLTDSTSKLTKIRDNLLTECNNRSDLITNILNIIKGEASPTSKFEVISDLFLPQIKMFLEERNHPNPVFIHQKFLSDKVNEYDLGYL